MMLQESVEFFLHTQNDRWDHPVSPPAPPRKAIRTSSASIILAEVAAVGDLSQADYSVDSTNSNRWNASSSCHDRAISIPRRHSHIVISRASRWYETLAFADQPRHPIQKRLSSHLLAMKIPAPSVWEQQQSQNPTDCYSLFRKTMLKKALSWICLYGMRSACSLEDKAKSKSIRTFINEKFCTSILWFTV